MVNDLSMQSCEVLASGISGLWRSFDSAQEDVELAPEFSAIVWNRRRFSCLEIVEMARGHRFLLYDESVISLPRQLHAS